MKKSSNKGFTLVELIIVIAILAIIMLIAIPNFSGIQQRMQVRADKATAAQIGKAVRIWYTEYQSDPAFKAVVNAGKKLPGPGENMLPLYELTSIEGYVDKTLKPTSLRKIDGTADEGQIYVVGLTGKGTYEKIIVSIVTTKRTGEGTAADPYVYTLTGNTPEVSIKIPAADANGKSPLDAKSSPKYDGQFVGTNGVTPSFPVSLAYVEP